jgi:hypothetical protein
MKQFKIIADNYNESSGGLISVNLNEVVTIAPDSKIVLDKFSCELIGDNSGLLELPVAQTIQYSPQYTQTSSAQALRDVVIPAGKYNFNNNIISGVIFNQLLDTIGELLNGSLNSNPQISTAVGSPTADLGFGFKCFTSSKGLSYIQCYQTNLNQQGKIVVPSVPPTINNLTTTSDSQYSPTNQGVFWLTCGKPLINGALQGRIQLRVGGVGGGANQWQIGLAEISSTQTTTAPVIKYGVGFNGNTAQCYFINDTIQTTAPFDKGALDTNGIERANFYFYTANNRLHLQILANDNSTLFFDSQTMGYANVFQGFRFATSYQLSINGFYDSGDVPQFLNIRLTEQPNLSLDNIGWYEDIPVNTKTYYTTNGLGAIRPRTIYISFKNAPELNNGLGYKNNTLTGYTDATSGTLLFESNTPINFATYLDLAINILNIPLQTYEGKTTGIDCGKKQTLCYFTPVREAENSNLYLFENKNLPFLSIANKEPINFSSLQFRIFNPSDPTTGINADYLSFNIYIADKDE